jgi:hypothetical protein
MSKRKREREREREERMLNEKMSTTKECTIIVSY